MDGASKFVKGDATAAMIITAMNLIGGIVVGVLQHHMAFGAATQQFSLSTVGDGLAAQIPALLISVATGSSSARAASDKDLGTDIANQILGQRKAPMVVPGVPHVRDARTARAAVSAIGAIFGAIGWSVRNGLRAPST